MRVRPADQGGILGALHQAEDRQRGERRRYDRATGPEQAAALQSLPMAPQTGAKQHGNRHHGEKQHRGAEDLEPRPRQVLRQLVDREQTGSDGHGVGHGYHRHEQRVVVGRHRTEPRGRPARMAVYSPAARSHSW
jgi:hypothetical protein